LGLGFSWYMKERSRPDMETMIAMVVSVFALMGCGGLLTAEAERCETKQPSYAVGQTVSMRRSKR
jgi:hypothetical protein